MLKKQSNRKQIKVIPTRSGDLLILAPKTCGKKYLLATIQIDRMA